MLFAILWFLSFSENLLELLVLAKTTQKRVDHVSFLHIWNASVATGLMNTKIKYYLRPIGGTLTICSSRITRISVAF